MIAILAGTIVLVNKYRTTIRVATCFHSSLVLRRSPAAPRCCARSAAREIDVSAPDGLREADGAAAALRAPRAAAAQADPADPARAGRGPARVLGPGRDGRAGRSRRSASDEWHNRPLSGRNVLHRVRLPADDAGLRRLPDRPPDDPRPDAEGRGRRRARRALPQRRPPARPGGHDAPARRQVQPGVRRRVHGRVHARRRVRRARRDLHVPVGVHAGLGRRLAVSRPRAQPHAEHVPRAVRRDDRAPEGREAARPHLHAVRPPVAAAGHPARPQRSTASTAAPTPATRRR